MCVQHIDPGTTQVTDEPRKLSDRVRTVKTLQGIAGYFAEIQVLYFATKHTLRFQGRKRDFVLAALMQPARKVQRLPLGAAFVEAVYELKNAWFHNFIGRGFTRIKRI
jgi:hypothetical protein